MQATATQHAPQESPMKVKDLFFELAQSTERNAYEKAEAIAADTRFNDGHKQAEFGKVMGEAIKWIDEQAEQTDKNLRAKIERLEGLVAVPLAPKLEEASALMYVKEVVFQEWERLLQTDQKRLKQGTGSSGEPIVDAAMRLASVTYHKQIKAGWENAIRQGDKLTARVYKDFAESFLRAARGVGADDPLPTALEFVTELHEKSLDMLRSEEQRNHAKELRQTRFDLSKLKFTVAATRQRLKDARLQGGKVTQKSLGRIDF